MTLHITHPPTLLPPQNRNLAAALNRAIIHNARQRRQSLTTPSHRPRHGHPTMKTYTASKNVVEFHPLGFASTPSDFHIKPIHIPSIISRPVTVQFLLTACALQEFDGFSRSWRKPRTTKTTSLYLPAPGAGYCITRSLIPHLSTLHCE